MQVSGSRFLEESDQQGWVLDLETSSQNGGV